jgi:hypothetical protein
LLAEYDPAPGRDTRLATFAGGELELRWADA